MMTPRPTEYAAMSDTQLRQLDIDYNGILHPAASAELHRRQLAANLRAAGRNPTQLLAELERRRNGPRSPRERLVALHAKRGPTRDPREALLALHAMRIAGNW